MKSHAHDLMHHADGCITHVSDWDSPIIRLCDVSMRYDRRKVLDGVNVSINYGDFVAITGPNGGGKTTMLRIILGLLKPTGGKVERFNYDGTPCSRIRTGYLPQKNMVDSHFPIVVREVIASGLLAERNLDNDEREHRIEDILGLIGLESHSRAPIGSLSGGQLQRTLLGRALISRADLLVLKEPLSYIDKRFESQLYDIMHEVADNTTVILVSHELSQIDHIANRHLIVDRNVEECKANHHYIVSPCGCGDKIGQNVK